MKISKTKIIGTAKRGALDILVGVVVQVTTAFIAGKIMNRFMSQPTTETIEIETEIVIDECDEKEVGDE